MQWSCVQDMGWQIEEKLLILVDLYEILFFKETLEEVRTINKRVTFETESDAMIAGSIFCVLLGKLHMSSIEIWLKSLRLLWDHSGI